MRSSGIEPPSSICSFEPSLFLLPAHASGSHLLPLFAFFKRDVGQGFDRFAFGIAFSYEVALQIVQAAVMIGEAEPVERELPQFYLS
jgi:hypothetical protein